MSWLPVMFAALIALVMAGAACWLVGPLADAVQWLGAADDGQAIAADDLRAADDELVAR